MNLSSQILASLERSEKQLLAILATAASAADYEAIDIARTAASEVRSIIQRLTRADQPSQKSRDKPHAPTGKKRPKARKKKNAKYPKFFVKDGNLFKEGWSKKDRAVYRHKVPEEAYRRVVDILQSSGYGSSLPVKTDSILEKIELGDEGIVPVYQTYVVLAFLRSAGVIRKVGRDGHVIPESLKELAENQWKSSLVEVAE